MFNVNIVRKDGNLFLRHPVVVDRQTCIFILFASENLMSLDPGTAIVFPILINSYPPKYHNRDSLAVQTLYGKHVISWDIFKLKWAVGVFNPAIFLFVTTPLWMLNDDINDQWPILIFMQWYTIHHTIHHTILIVPCNVDID